MKVPFRERDPRLLAVVGTAIVVVVAAASLLLPQAFFYLSTTTYEAEFSNAGGLQTGDPVYVAGVPSGRVSDMAVDGDRVRVSFRMDRDREVGSETTAGIKIQTVLGKRYLDLVPRGDEKLAPDTPIPLERTSVAYSLDDLSRDSSTAAEEIDLDALRALMDSLEKDTPDAEVVGEALEGVLAATRVFNEHSDEFRQIVRGAQHVTSSLLEQTDTLVALLGDADLLTGMLAQRRDAIGQMITDIATLSRQVEAFLDTNRPAVESLMERLESITLTLERAQEDFNETLEQLAPASRYIATGTGYGPWGDVNSPSAIIPDNLLCLAGLVEGCS